MADERPAEHTGTLSRLMPCDRCQHDEHVMRCDAEVIPGVLCRCRDVPVPGLYP
ncbi:hypothetical protein [Nocardioides sp. YIM 152315]|uniref:hypothetical protein n=1 Tax=Nocardioides sp. YIM 152315 TaxID=3031760 RepID=UPI0023DA57FE|nr:hypothetical protein [Nocardioides sp. YIM 152315]MDF1603410.1 hypothetical protein [Nocardioides sp. YIM 152315]